MKFTFALLTALVAPLLAGAVSVTPERRVQNLNPHNVELHDPLAVTPSEDHLSNAERLRRGLTIKAPRIPHTPTRAGARRAAASGVSRTGYYKIVKADDGSDLGFVGKDFNVFGEYGLVEKKEDALPISFTVPADGSLFDISNHNSDQSPVYPFIGLTNGFASTSEDVSEGSMNYAYLTGVQKGKNAASDGKPNSFSAATGIDKSSQSLVWKIDNDSKMFSAEWSNTDGVFTPIECVYYSADDTIICTGDSEAFLNAFGRDGNPKIKLVFVEIDN
jgi:hypothetical protein